MEKNEILDSVCGVCGREVSFDRHPILERDPYSGHSEILVPFEVLQCPRCGSGSVLNLRYEHRAEADAMEVDRLMKTMPRERRYFEVSPGSSPMPRVKNLPKDVDSAWHEALGAGRAEAWTASELMCRKILMHIAVDQFEMEEGKAFVAYVKKFEEEGFFPRMMHPVIDGIRERGNRATHDLAQSTYQQAMKTLEVTHHVLRTIYEISFQED